VQSESLKDISKAITKNTLMETLGIEFTRLEGNYLEATMPVNSRVYQPAGLLHGGASVALAESIGSCGSFLLVKDSGAKVVGIEINANHIKSTQSGIVTAKASIVHQGKRTHVWEIRIMSEDDELLSICRLTNMILLPG
jgi:uncharacterized protein (TIGR00369 family)